MIKKIAQVFAILLLGLLFYFVAEILIARSNTADIVAAALASERIQLELDDLSKEQVDALLKIQDPDFYNHKGVDFWTPGTGITTLSQGLVKMYYFENFQPGFQKIKQTLIARFAFDPLTPKNTILKLFINEAYLGEKEDGPIKGFQQGSLYYFNKDFKMLNWDEYLSLVAMIRAPYIYNYHLKKDENQLRVKRIKKMLSGEYVPIDNSDFLYDRY